MGGFLLWSISPVAVGTLWVCHTKTMQDEGRFGWLGMTIWIILWDIWAWRTGHQTMTVAFKKLTHTPIGRIVLTVIWGALTLHLFTEKADPHQVARKLHKRWKET